MISLCSHLKDVHAPLRVWFREAVGLRLLLWKACRQTEPRSVVDSVWDCLCCKRQSLLCWVCFPVVWPHSSDRVYVSRQCKAGNSSPCAVNGAGCLTLWVITSVLVQLILAPSFWGVIGWFSLFRAYVREEETTRQGQEKNIKTFWCYKKIKEKKNIWCSLICYRINPVGVKMSSGHHTVLSQPCALGKANVTVPKAAHEVRSKALDDQSRFCHFSAHSQDAPKAFPMDAVKWFLMNTCLCFFVRCSIMLHKNNLKNNKDDFWVQKTALVENRVFFFFSDWLNDGLGQDLTDVVIMSFLWRDLNCNEIWMYHNAQSWKYIYFGCLNTDKVKFCFFNDQIWLKMETNVHFEASFTLTRVYNFAPSSYFLITLELFRSWVWLMQSCERNLYSFFLWIQNFSCLVVVWFSFFIFIFIFYEASYILNRKRI